jgi:Xaa-Pro dipeptidase
MPSLRGDLNSYRRPAACMIPRMDLDFSDKNRELGALYASHIEEICRRHDHALERAGASHAVIFSGAPKYAFLDDNTYPFRANPHFVGWAPLTGLPLSYIVYTPGESPVLIYYQPRDYWHPVPGHPDGYWTSHFDIRIVNTTEEIAAHLPQDREKCILIGELDDGGHAFGIDRVNPTTAINILHYARGSSKTAYELACMRLAARRGVRGHRAAARAFAEGLSEFSIHQAFCEATVHAENELPYGNIIAINEHGAILHYTDLDREPPAEIRSFLIDAGARVHGYASDITRTYSNGDARFSELIARMEALQQDVVSRVKAGVDYRELHLHTHRLIAGVLVDSGIANGDVDALLAEGVTSAFFPHGVGHLLGIQVHDVAGFMENETGTTIDPPSGHPFLRLTRVLEEDMVLTIEPGIYFIDMLLDNLRDTPAETLVEWRAVDGLRPFGGIRIEDDIRVLTDGHENLTRDAFAELQ